MSQTIQVEGRIISVLPGTMFRVELGANKHIVLAHISGKMRKNFVRLTNGDKVIIEMSPHDLEKGRILRRIDANRPPMMGGRPMQSPGSTHAQDPR